MKLLHITNFKKTGLVLFTATALCLFVAQATFAQGPPTSPGAGEETATTTTTDEPDEATDVGHPDIPDSQPGMVFGDGYVFDDDYMASLDGMIDSGVPGEDIAFYYDEVVVPSDSAVSDEQYIINMCESERASYPSARSCRVSCELSSGDWAMGDACGADDPVVGYTFAYADDISNQCYDSASACQDASGPYTEWGLTPQESGGEVCHEVERGRGDSDWCFSYEAEQDPGEAAFTVGTGDTCYPDTEAGINTCRTRMIITYPQAEEWSNDELCRQETKAACEWDDISCGRGGSAEVTKWCGNDNGLVGLSLAEQRARERALEEQAAEDARIAEEERIQRERDEFNEGVRADYEAMQEAGSLVSCAGVLLPDDDDEDFVECDWNALIRLANNLIDFAIQAAAVVMVLMMAFAGWKLITAQGSTEQLSSARKALTKAVIGFVIVLTAWLIVDTVMNSLLDAELQGDGVVDLLGD